MTYHPNTFLRKTPWLLALGFLLLGLTSCNKPRKLVYTKEQLRKISAAKLSEVPKLTHPLNVNFENKIRLIGVEGPKKAIRPGGRCRITYYWQSLEELSGEWTVFGHLEQPGKRQLLDHDPVDNLYGIKHWKKGEIIKDIQTVTLDKDLVSGNAVLWIGIFNVESWRQSRANDRLKVVDAGNVKEHGDNRLKVLTLAIGGAGKKKTPKGPRPRYTARPASSPIVVDGSLNEAAWAKASKTRTFVLPSGKTGNKSLDVLAKVVYDDERIYFAFDAKDPDIQSTMTDRDDPLWTADVVEIFIDPDGDGKNYLEMQVSPNNVVFDAIFPSKDDREWKTYAPKTNLDIESGVHLVGTLNNGNDQDTRWTAELSVPFSQIPGVNGKPKMGSRWTVNLYRIDDKANRRAKYMRQWAAVGGNFHNFQKSGVLTFAAAIPTSPSRSNAKRRPGAVPTPPVVRPSPGLPTGEATRGKAPPEPKAVTK